MKEQLRASQEDYPEFDVLGYFDPIIVSGDHGYRKPDRRLFQLALEGMRVSAENTLYVGNDMYRDIYGAREAGLKTVMFDSDQGTKTRPRRTLLTRSSVPMRLFVPRCDQGTAAPSARYQ
jgi:FMN phosphatase YigB (HAD superfamily)